jgi:phosphonate transport system substrate-binding protein
LKAVLLFWAALAGTVPAMGGAAPFTFGVFPRWNAQITIRDFGPLARELGSALGEPLRVETDKDFPSFMARVYRGEFDLVHLNQLQYLRARDKAGYRALAKMCEEGTCTIRGMIVARADSEVSDLAGLKGKTVAFAGPSALVSHVLATAMLAEAGLKAPDYRAVVAKNPPNALFAVYNRAADAAGVGSSLLHRPEILRRIDIRRLRVLARSRPVPHLPIAVRGDLAPELAQRVQQALVRLHEHPAGREALHVLGIERFEAADDAEYRVIEDILSGRSRATP